MPQAEKKAVRVRDFIYYPLMSGSDCAFRVETKKGSHTYHQCLRTARRTMEGYGFCLKHATHIERVIETISIQATSGLLSKPET